MAHMRVVLDANVLYPFSLRDTLLRAAEFGLFQVYWSDEILEETRRNLVASAGVSEELAERLITLMKTAFPEAVVAGYGTLVDSMANHPKDRHVAAAAHKADAQLIITHNLKDFVPLPQGIEARSPDDFLCDLFDLDPQGMFALLRAQAEALRNPPVSLDSLLTGLAKTVPSFVQVVAAYFEL